VMRSTAACAVTNEHRNHFHVPFISFKTILCFSIFSARVSSAVRQPFAFNTSSSSSSSLACICSSFSSSWDTDMVDRRPVEVGDSRCYLVVGRRRRTVCRHSGVDFVTSLSSVDSHPCLDVSTIHHLSVQDHRRHIACCSTRTRLSNI